MVYPENEWLLYHVFEWGSLLDGMASGSGAEEMVITREGAIVLDLVGRRARNENKERKRRDRDTKQENAISSTRMYCKSDQGSKIHIELLLPSAGYLSFDTRADEGYTKIVPVYHATRDLGSATRISR